MDKTKQEIEQKVNRTIHEVPKGLLKWYDFTAGKKALYFGQENDSYAEALIEEGLEVCCVSTAKIKDDAWCKKNESVFSYIVMVANFELEEEPQYLFDAIAKILASDGRVLLGMNNRLGIRYFLGDKDIYTNQIFDGLERYRRTYATKADVFSGKMYARSEVEQMLQMSGLSNRKFYSVFPDLIHPQMIYADGYIPKEDLSRRIFPMYHNAPTVFMEEQYVYQSLMENGLFHQMANAYLIEISRNDSFSDVTQVTSSIERDANKAMLTIIHGTTSVEKKAVYNEGREQLERMIENQENLKKRGLKVVDGKLIGNSYHMPYINAPSAQEYFNDLLQSDKERFFEELDRYRDMILRASDIETEDAGDGLGPIAYVGYPDMGLINCFYIDGEFVLFDQEFAIEHCPINFSIFRLIWGFHFNDVDKNKLIPIGELWKRYGLDKKLEYWQKMDHEFIDGVRNDDDLRAYHAKYRADLGAVFANRQRMNYTIDEYRKKFIDIFADADQKKIVLFGSGKFAEKYMAIYAKDYPAYAVIDNNESRWGKEISGVKIQSPAILQEFDSSEYKILICIKNFTTVARQLENMGIADYAIFDSNMDYPRKLKEIEMGSRAVEDSNVSTEKKRYHVGYVAGVFDMFHVGHLNLIRKAKEQCDYLIVGVVSDEGVYRQKKKYPIIPIEDRVEVLESVRYVDQVEVLPLEYSSIRDAYKMFHFDAQFSGDDHGESANWDAEREYLREHGSDLVFIKYTEKVSSTKLREKLTEDTNK